MKTLLHRLGMAIIGHDDDYDYDDNFDGTDAYDDYGDYEDAAAEDDYAESSHAENGNQVAFCGGENSDGKIHKGNITVERTVSGIKETYPHYKKGTEDYIKVGSQFIRIDNGSFTINNVQYKGVRI